MRYRVEIHGLGQEVLMGRVNNEFFDLIVENDLDFAEYAADDMFLDNEDIDVEDHVLPFYPGEPGGPNELVVDESGPVYPEAYINVYQEDQLIIQNAKLSNSQLGIGTEYDMSLSSLAHLDINEGDCYYTVDVQTQGMLATYEFEDVNFIPSRLNFVVTPISGVEIITSVSYNGIQLEDTGEMDARMDCMDVSLVKVHEDYEQVIR